MNIDLEKDIVQSLSSLYPLQEFEEKAIHTILDALPPIQPEIIIYCKDCMHRDGYRCCKYWKGLVMGEIPIATDDYGFCNHAKRRTRG